VLTEIKNRGVNDVLMVVCDGLIGLPDAVTATWPATITLWGSRSRPGAVTCGLRRSPGGKP
jgi:hypothetical protein